LNHLSRTHPPQRPRRRRSHAHTRIPESQDQTPVNLRPLEGRHRLRRPEPDAVILVAPQRLQERRLRRIPSERGQSLDQQILQIGVAGPAEGLGQRTDRVESPEEPRQLCHARIQEQIAPQGCPERFEVGLKDRGHLPTEEVERPSIAEEPGPAEPLEKRPEARGGGDLRRRGGRTLPGSLLEVESRKGGNLKGDPPGRRRARGVAQPERKRP